MIRRRPSDRLRPGGARRPQSPLGGSGSLAALPGLDRSEGIAPLSLRLIGLLVLAAAALLALSAGSATAATANFCPSGSGAGKCNEPDSVAVDQSTGNVYVGEENNARVSVFDSSGKFLRAFGFGVTDGSEELQTCTTVCIEGRGFFFRPVDLAVDNTAGPSAGDIYAFSFSGGVSSLEKYGFDPVTEEYELLTTISGEGTGPGQFSGQAHPLAVDSAGHIWVGDYERLEEFSETGAFLSEVALPGAGEVQSLAVDAAGDFYLVSSEVVGVQKRGPAGELLETIDEGGAPTALALDPTGGDVFVADNPTGESGAATLLIFDSSGTQIEGFGAGEVIGHPQGNALAFGTAAVRLYVVSSDGQESSAAQAFVVPPPGPLPGAGTSTATEIEKTVATLCAEVNPEGKSTTVHFDYITTAGYEADGNMFGEGTVSTPESAPIGADFSPHQICQRISPLVPATAYRFRVLATNSDAPAGVSGEAAAFSALPAAAIDSTGASEVTAGSATLEAQIDPLGDATFYDFEYLTEAAYQANLGEGTDGFSGAQAPTTVPVPAAAIGAGLVDVSVSQHLQGLTPGTVYRYRVVIRNAVSEAHGGPYPGPTEAFTTQSFVGFGLPDDRAWEQVSPPDKHGTLLGGLERDNGPVVQASPDGDALAYGSSGPTETDPLGNTGQTAVLASRGPDGWSSHDLALPHPDEVGAAIHPEYRFFSTDLSRSLSQPFGGFSPQLSPAASEQTPYIHSDFASGMSGPFCTTACDSPLVAGCPAADEPCPPAVAVAADVPAGTKFGLVEGKTCPPAPICGPRFDGASPDLEHVVLSDEVDLTSAAAPEGGLYEYSADKPPAEALQLLSVLPDGQPAPEGAISAGVGANHLSLTDSRNAISSDGSRVVFETQNHIYLRYNATEPQSEMVAGVCAEPTRACTVQLDEVQAGAPGGSEIPEPNYQTATVDGSRIFFTDRQQLILGSGNAPGSTFSLSGGDLYEYDLEKPANDRLTDLTPPVAGEAAGVRGFAIPGASEDGEWVYFVANGVLGDGAEHGAAPGDCTDRGGPAESCNLYLLHGGVTTFIAALSGADEPDWAGTFGLPGLTSRVSPGGHWLAFMSQRSLTGYDNHDALSGMPDEEVFLYHASASGGSGRLICASCNPSGARPHGVEAEQIPLAVGGTGGGVWGAENTSLAANVPGWTAAENDPATAFYQSRYLSDSGRLFFNSSDALVPADTNAAEDVYEYEPSSGEGTPPSDTCTSASPTYSPTSGGCADLISSGTSKEESAFIDASESGDDVFFLTNAQLAKTDTDTALDIYDARSGGGFSEAAATVECSGDACQQPAVPPNHPTPGTALLNGPGNVGEGLRCKKSQARKHGRCVKKRAKNRNHEKSHTKKHRHHVKGKKSRRADPHRGGHK